LYYEYIIKRKEVGEGKRPLSASGIFANAAS